MLIEGQNFDINIKIVEAVSESRCKFIAVAAVLTLCQASGACSAMKMANSGRRPSVCLGLIGIDVGLAAGPRFPDPSPRDPCLDGTNGEFGARGDPARAFP